jgi:hypothetical protein
LVIFHIYAFRNFGELMTGDESQIDWHVLAPLFPLQPNEEIIIVELLVAAVAMVYSRLFLVFSLDLSKQRCL